MKAIYSFFILSVFLSISYGCKKDTCIQDLNLVAPSSVMEGEDIYLSVTGADEAVNNSYYWGLADMSYYSTLVDGMVEVSGPDPIIIENADLRDNGSYAFRIIPGQAGECPKVQSDKIITVIPKVSPCYNTTTENVLFIDESFSSGVINQTFTPTYENIWSSGSDFHIGLSMPMFTYAMDFYFYILPPEHSSTYTLRNYYQNASDGSVEDDFFIQAEVYFCPDNEGGNSYRVTENLDNLYVKREGNQLVLTFCDVEFSHITIPSKTVTISGKVRVDL